MPPPFPSPRTLRAIPDEAPIETSPLRGAIHTFPPLVVQVVSQSKWERVWDALVRRYHYLGYQRLLGHRLKYLAFLQGRPVAALSFSAPALKLRVRDQYIGWSPAQRTTHLTRLVNNSRFLILPWVEVANLASQVLARTLARLADDWEAWHGTRLWLVETFIDPARFRGTCYRAANWRGIGQTAGSGKQGKGYRYHGSIKEVYVYSLEPRFRDQIGCVPHAYHRLHRPSPCRNHVEDLKMILRHTAWHPQLVPGMTLTAAEVEGLADELVQFHEQFQEGFGRIEHHRLGLAYLSGLLSQQDAKSVEPIALAFLDHAAVRPLQRFMKAYRWDHEWMEQTHHRLLAQTLADPEGMLTVDSREFAKKGTQSVGVARQYCGALGKVDNCQSGVFVGYTSHKGYGLLSGRLYLPQGWLGEDAKARRDATLVPEDVVFQTKPQIATALIKTIDQTHLFPAKWLGCDAAFGADWAFLDAVPPSLSYFASIRSTTRVFLTKPVVGLKSYAGQGRRPTIPHIMKGTALTVGEIAQSTHGAWTRVVLTEGAKGPIRAEVARFRVYPSRDGVPPDSPVWLFLRRTADGQIKCAFSNAPQETSLAELGEAATLRWPIEQCFQDGKSHVGMDHYEHRSWPAWHRHMLYVFLALHFLLRLRIRFKKNSGPDAPASTTPGSRRTAQQATDARLCLGTRELSYEEKSYRLYLTQEKTTGRVG